MHTVRRFRTTVLFSYVVFLFLRGGAWAAIIIVPFVLAGLAMSLWLIVSGVKGLMSASRRSRTLIL